MRLGLSETAQGTWPGAWQGTGIQRWPFITLPRTQCFSVAGDSAHPPIQEILSNGPSQVGLSRLGERVLPASSNDTEQSTMHRTVPTSKNSLPQMPMVPRLSSSAIPRCTARPLPRAGPRNLQCVWLKAPGATVVLPAGHGTQAELPALSW